MISETIQVKSPNGIHLRVAAKVVQAVRQHKAQVRLYKDGKEASAESILELLILGATQNSQVTIVAEGKNEQQALKDIELVLMDGAGI